MFISTVSQGLYLKGYSENSNKALLDGLKDMNLPSFAHISYGNTVIAWMKYQEQPG
jgi:hypothetical protein